MKQQIITKTRTNTTLLVVLGVLSISLAGFFASSLFSNNKIASQASLITPRTTNAAENTDDPIKILRGSLVNIAQNQTATFSRTGGGKYTVNLIDTQQVTNPQGCFLTYPYRAHLTYMEYDARNNIIDTQDLIIGPCDDGWAAEVVKADAAGRALLTIPRAANNVQ